MGTWVHDGLLFYYVTLYMFDFFHNKKLKRKRRILD